MKLTMRSKLNLVTAPVLKMGNDFQIKKVNHLIVIMDDIFVVYISLWNHYRTFI